MKPFLGIDLTQNKKNEKLNNEAFLVDQPSPAMVRSLELSSKIVEETMKRSKLSPLLQIVQRIFGLIGALIAFSILRAVGGSDGISMSQAYQNASWLFWIGGICLLIWGILKIISIQKERNVQGIEERTRVLSNFEGTCNAIYSMMAVPADAKEVDVLSFFYKVKDGKVKVDEKLLQLAPYFNPVFKVFIDGENLYLANLEGKYEVPLSSLVSIHTVKKHIQMVGWNKDELFNTGKYKQYKLTADQYGRIHCRCYYILEMNCNGESWGIYIPCYELPIFEALTGLKAQDEKMKKA
jgi:hypothetical protein